MSKQIKHYLGDRDVQLILGTLLRVGVLVSTAIVIIGGVVFLSTQTNQIVSFESFKPEQAKFSSVAEIFNGLKSVDGLAIIQFGVLLLIFTPIARVVFSIFSFLMEKDYMYVLIGIIVLCVIITSLYLDIAH
ncbi:DUF1634 domain-containing protein [Pedobacter frigiditerrae]|uniref:DUF1634 domain-containing protein n=1 Tax=Pedobacter frigiditerrae TaxID=2530452 RepID=A0A4R0MNA4_9SPHI|nr:DUF1634 domain-containing protein [Pedobacter frigiditerrae]TCC88103.1 DUF1634 domain-containing protein [Pedobacter frigiditerrae]